MPGPKMPRPKHGERRQHNRERLLNGRLAAGIGLGNCENSPVPMPTMTASTITLMPEATMLPSTFSARKAVLLKSAKGMRMKPASVVSLNSIKRDEELDRQDEEGDQHQQPGHHQNSDLDEVCEEAGEAHHLAGASSNG